MFPYADLTIYVQPAFTKGFVIVTHLSKCLNGNSLCSKGIWTVI